MKNKGFTLIELLAVIIILAIILVIAVPSVIKLIDDSKQKNYENQVSLIKDAAKLFITKNNSEKDLVEIGDNINITLLELVEEGSLSNFPVDPRTNENFSENFIVQVTKAENGLNYELVEMESWTFEVTIPAGGDTFSFEATNASFTINWGDESETTNSYSGDNYIEHSYSEGTYDVVLLGTASHISFCDLDGSTCLNGTPEYLSDIKTAIPLSMGLTNATGMFKGIEIETFTSTDFFDEAIPNITNISYMFADTDFFNQDIGSWDTSNVTNMDSTFRYAVNFNQNISIWDTSNVTNMDNMFMFALDFNQDLSSWCVNNISSEPDGFSNSTFSWTLSKPVWGTCS